MQGTEIDEYIKNKYERTNESDTRGTNHIAIGKFIDLIHLHENCENTNIRNIAKNIKNLEELVPNFTIFETKERSAYYITFAAYSLDHDSDKLVDAHEFGHLVIHGINKFELDEEKFSNIVKNARANCISSENKQDFRKYVERLQDRNNKDITDAEKGPVSDILSSVFQYPSLSFKNEDGTISEKMVFPSFHDREYYFDEEKGKMRTDRIFDEDFANYYSLVLNGCTKELGILRKFLGEEWMQSMEQELEKAGKNIQMPDIDKNTDINKNSNIDKNTDINKNSNVDKNTNIDSKLGEVLMTQREGALPKELPINELEEQRDTNIEEIQK